MVRPQKRRNHFRRTLQTLPETDELNLPIHRPLRQPITTANAKRQDKQRRRILRNMADFATVSHIVILYQLYEILVYMA